MVWPTTPVSTANVDAGSDSISAARADIKDAFDKLNQIISDGPGGGGVPEDILVNTIDTYNTGTVEFLANVVLTGTGNDVGTIKNYAERIVALGTTSGTLTIDVSAAPVYTVTCSGAITINIANVTNITAGRSVSIIVRQNGTGGYALTSNIKFAGGKKTLSTAANAIDVINIFYDGTDLLASLVTGYA